MKDNYLVTKSNTLITSSYDLSLEEQRIILTLASTVQDSDEDFKPYKFSIKEFMNLLGVEDKSKYSAIPKITKELMQKVIEIKKGNKILQVAWLSSAEYEKGTGCVELEFSPKLKPFMLGLKEFYTSYRLANILELKGKYSIRMYEILKSNEYKKAALISVDELREILKINTGSYKVYQNFKNRILLQAQKELNEKTDIKFTFDEIKEGRKVAYLKFYISSNEVKNKTIEPKNILVEKEVAPTVVESVDIDEKSIKELQNTLKELNLNKKDCVALLKVADKNIDIIKEKYELSKSVKNLKNLVGWLIKAIREDYKGKEQSNNKFNDFEQRNYDFGKLEADLLGIDEESCDETPVNFSEPTNENNSEDMDEITKKIEKIKELKDKGLISEEVYNQRVNKILDEID